MFPNLTAILTVATFLAMMTKNDQPPKQITLCSLEQFPVSNENALTLEKGTQPENILESLENDAHTDQPITLFSMDLEKLVFPVTIAIEDRTICTVALINPSAPVSYVCDKFVDGYNLPVVPYTEKYKLYNVRDDIYQCPTCLHGQLDFEDCIYSEPTILEQKYNLEAPIVLDLDWLKKHEPRIYWNKLCIELHSPIDSPLTLFDDTLTELTINDYSSDEDSDAYFIPFTVYTALNTTPPTDDEESDSDSDISVITLLYLTS